MSSVTDAPAPAAPARAPAGYAFVNNVRFVSMAGIVAIHAEVMPVHWEGGHWNVALDQFGKFATVCFFLISGFLLGDRIESVSPTEYMARRLRTTFVPWSVWTSVYFVMIVAIDRLARGADARPLTYHLFNTLFNSAYWFVPNILVSLGTLLLFRRWLNSAWLGAALGSSALAYGLNLYFRWWAETRHTTAWFGFVFFLWLGYQLRRHFTAVKAVVERAPWGLLWGLAAGTYAVALGEAWLLNRWRGPEFDYLSTLRPSNVAYSLAVFALLFKVRRPLEPPGMNARQHTFGIYLLHTIVFAITSRAFKVVASRVAGVDALTFTDHITDYIATPGARLAAQAGVFAVVYLASWAGVAVLSRTPLSRYIGVRE